MCQTPIYITYSKIPYERNVSIRSRGRRSSPHTSRLLPCSQVPAVTAMFHGHVSVAKTLLRAFSDAKMAPKRSRLTASLAAAALASGAAHAEEPDSAAAAAAIAPGSFDPNHMPPEGSGGGSHPTRGVSKMATLRTPPNGAGAEVGGSGEGGLDGIMVVPPGGSTLGSSSAVGGGGKGQNKTGDGGVASAGDAGVGTSTDGVEPQEGTRASSGAASDGEGSEQSNTNSRASLSRRASEAGIAVSGAGCCTQIYGMPTPGRSKLSRVRTSCRRKKQRKPVPRKMRSKTAQEKP